MGSTEATYDGLRMPETMEPCWRCSAPEPLHVVKRQTLSAKHTASGEPEPQPDAHFYVCSHCGYQVPEPGRVGFVMKELAALRWNGEMLGKRMKRERETRQMFLGATVEGAVQDAVAKVSAGLPNVRIIVDGKEVARTVTTEGTDGYTESGGETATPRVCGNCNSTNLSRPLEPQSEPGKFSAVCRDCEAECVVLEGGGREWRGGEASE